MGGFRGYNPSCLKVFFDKGPASFHLCWVERINFGDPGGEVRVKVDGMVIGVMGRELVMGFLGEDICEVFAPFGYNGVNRRGGLGDLGGDGGSIDLFSFQPGLSFV